MINFEIPIAAFVPLLGTHGSDIHYYGGSKSLSHLDRLVLGITEGMEDDSKLQVKKEEKRYVRTFSRVMTARRFLKMFVFPTEEIVHFKIKPEQYPNFLKALMDIEDPYRLFPYEGGVFIVFPKTEKLTRLVLKEKLKSS